MKTLLQLYPAAWKVRHLEEVALMLDDTGAGLSAAPDIIRGAVDAHLHPGPMGLPTGGVRRWLTPDHIAGSLALVGGIVWFVAFALVATDMLIYSGDGWRELRPLVLLAAAGPLVTTALVTSLARHRGDRLQTAAGAAAAALSIFGAVLLFQAIWVIASEPAITFGSDGGAHVNPALVTLLVGSIIGGAALLDVHAVPRRWLAVLVVGAALVLFALYSRSGSPLPEFHSAAAWMVGGLVYGAGWTGVGIALPRRPTPSVHEGSTQLV
jgi:hypothetical protein